MTERGMPQPPIQVRALRMVNRLLPSSQERAFVLRWLEPRADKAEKKAIEKAKVRASPVERARAQAKREKSSALRKADTAFSILVRTMGTHVGPDGTRWGACITCPITAPYKPFAELQAGHWIKRKKWGTRYAFWNVHPQCPNCNNPLRGNGRVELHEQFIRATHGATAPEALLTLSKTKLQRPREFEFLTMAEDFSRRTAEFLAMEERRGKA